MFSVLAPDIGAHLTNTMSEVEQNGRSVDYQAAVQRINGCSKSYIIIFCLIWIDSAVQTTSWLQAHNETSCLFMLSSCQHMLAGGGVCQGEHCVQHAQAEPKWNNLSSTYVIIFKQDAKNRFLFSEQLVLLLFFTKWPWLLRIVSQYTGSNSQYFWYGLLQAGS